MITLPKWAISTSLLRQIHPRVAYFGDRPRDVATRAGPSRGAGLFVRVFDLVGVVVHEGSSARLMQCAPHVRVANTSFLLPKSPVTSASLEGILVEQL